MIDHEDERARLRDARDVLENARAGRDGAIRAAALAGLAHREIGREVGLSGVQVGRIVAGDSRIPRERRATWIAHALTFVPKRLKSDDDLTQSRFRMVLQNVLTARLAGNPEVAHLKTIADVVGFASEGLSRVPDYDPSLLELEWPKPGQIDS